MTKFDNAYERALKRAEKAKQAFDNLPELNDQEKELCHQYVDNNYDGPSPKITVTGLYNKRTGLGLRIALDKVEAYISVCIQANYGSLGDE